MKDYPPMTAEEAARLDEVLSRYYPRPLLVDEHGAAKLLSISVDTLRADRLGARRIPFVKIGKLVRYNVAALTKFAEDGAP